MPVKIKISNPISILLRMPISVENIPPINNFTIWCRNSDICENAKPCNSLDCPFKKNKHDVEKGIKKCHLYAVTEKSLNWNSAKHVDEYHW